MKIYYTTYKTLRYSIFLMMFVFLGISSSFGQANMTKIKDGSISGSSTVPGISAILELESTNKGFLMPRLSTQQRDAIALDEIEEGLMIFNTTTGCFNFWSSTQSVWLSLCGTPPPAAIEISEAQCQAISVHGNYLQGEELLSGNFLRIPVTVTQAGSYDVMVSTENGYYFYTQGSFPAAGRYTLVLPGAGTPSKGYEPAANGGTNGIGDKLSVTFNGQEQEICDKRVFVVKAPVNYTFSCNDIEVVGDYMIGKPLDASNKIKIKVNVSATGYWNIQTNTVNGYSFRGTGKFEQEGEQEIELLGTGAPIASGTNSLGLTVNSEGPVNCKAVNVTVLPVSYTVNCEAPVIAGTYKHDVSLNASNTVKLKINVKATGKTEIKTNTSSGMTFTTGVIVLDKLGEQVVTLTGSGKPTSSGTKNFTLVATAGMEATCGFSIPVTQQDVLYTMDCSTIKVEGDYAPNFPMKATNTILVNVDVKYVGKYEIKTNTVNGISFKGTGTFTKVGKQNVKLTATGTGRVGGIHRYKLTANSLPANAYCTAEVTFVFRAIKVLGLGTGSYQPGSASNTQSPRAILQSKVNFSPTGTFKTEGITIINGERINSASSLRSLINRNDIDIIFIGFNFSSLTFSDATILEVANVLKDFVVNKKGVLLFSDESLPKFGVQALKAIDAASSNPTFTFLGNYINPIQNVDDPLLNGPFGDIRGKLIGTDAENGIYIKGYSSNFVNLVNHASTNSGSWMIKHKTLGAVFIADAGWASGGTAKGTETSGPAKIASTGHTPISKQYGGNSREVYNSVLYANTFAWAIQYVQENTDPNYQVK